nr:ATP-binding protein [Deltaproteobacteria bacterium]
LNESVESMLKMIRRLIGENIDLVWLPGKGRCTVRMDRSQLDQILVNLCVNAKDAIRDVGRLSIETDTAYIDETYGEKHAEIVPGEYVLLSISDNGSGMDRETMEHIFEPFFTTKGIGKGTGLGLATVYGIVKQNQGFINVYSEPGKGTTFRIYFPLNASEEEAELPEEQKETPGSRGETILIVEDDPTLLKMSARMLEQLGYTVLSAGTPNEAIRIAEDKSSEIDLFITDVIMPEMNGRDLAQRILSIRPAIKHLFMSGYTADVIAHQGVLDKGVHYLQKPFSLKDFAIKIRTALS